MKKLLKYLDNTLSILLIISASAMVLVVLLQIIARYALPWSPHWTEEVARFCFIYMVSLGAGLAIKDNAYINVTTFLMKFSNTGRLYMESIILFSICLLMLIMFIYCFPLLNIVKLQTSAALQINMAFIYFSMMVMSFFVMFYALVQLIEKLRQLKGYL